MNIKIRQENFEDFKDVFELNKLAFKRTDEAILVEALRKTDAFIPELSLVAINENIIVGHILFTKINIIDVNRNEHKSLALAPVAVLPTFQNCGIGGQLIIDGLKKSKALKYNSVIVLGHENYYPKFGFEPASKWNIKAPFEVPDDNYMAIELITNGLQNISGVVQYSKAFDNV